jgi:hypothetical protein
MIQMKNKTDNIRIEMQDFLRHKSTTPHIGNFNVAAVLFTNGKKIGDIHTNSIGAFCRGHVCASIHAEVAALTAYCGKHISYSPMHGWQQWRFKEAKQCRYFGD